MVPEDLLHLEGEHMGGDGASAHSGVKTKGTRRRFITQVMALSWPAPSKHPNPEDAIAVMRRGGMKWIGVW